MVDISIRSPHLKSGHGRKVNQSRGKGGLPWPQANSKLGYSAPWRYQNFSPSWASSSIPNGQEGLPYKHINRWTVRYSNLENIIGANDILLDPRLLFDPGLGGNITTYLPRGNTHFTYRRYYGASNMLSPIILVGLSKLDKLYVTPSTFFFKRSSNMVFAKLRIILKCSVRNCHLKRNTKGVGIS